MSFNCIGNFFGWPCGVYVLKTQREETGSITYVLLMVSEAAGVLVGLETIRLVTNIPLTLLISLLICRRIRIGLL